MAGAAQAEADNLQHSNNDNVRPEINENPELQSYYGSLESRIGYRLVLGGTRHFGYWDNDTWWPFPISSSLRRMEQKMLQRLGLPERATVLDAGCGIGHVALYMARNGNLQVTAIDFMEHHVQKAQKNFKRAGLPEGQLTAQRADYHNLEWIADESLNGIYTMETLVHATNLEKVLRGFYRILTPGGRLVDHEYEVNIESSKETGSLANEVEFITNMGAMPLDLMKKGHLKATLEKVGFVDVSVQDYSDNVRPMLRLFHWMAFIPYFIVKLLHLEKYFINIVGGFGGIIGQKYWNYISVSATKPGSPVETAKTK